MGGNYFRASSTVYDELMLSDKVYDELMLSDKPSVLKFDNRLLSPEDGFQLPKNKIVMGGTR